MFQQIVVFLDLDGVLVDLNKGLKDQFGFEFPKERTEENRKIIHDMWYDIAKNNPRFWSNLPPTDDCYSIYNAAKSIDPNLHILSATPEPFTGIYDIACRNEKVSWVWNKLGYLQATRAIITKSKLKQNHMVPDKINILVDDHPGNIERWIAAGGVGIHHTNLENTLKELSKWK